MYLKIFLVFCGAVVLTNSYPTPVLDYYNPNIGDVEDFRQYRDNYHNYKQNPCVRFQNSEVKCYFQNGILENIPEILDYALLPEPMDITASQNLDIYNENVNLENSAPSELVSLNPNYNVYNYESSPIHTYIHGLVPQDTPVVYEDIYTPEDLSPFNRLARRTSSYEEFLAQLSHDAQMNNILPTMPVLRTAGNQYVPYGIGPVPVRASFPQAVSGCARPLIFGCSPTIYRGVLAHKGYPYALAAQVPTVPSYKESTWNRKVIRNKVKPTVDTNKKDIKPSNDQVTDDFIVN